MPGRRRLGRAPRAAARLAARRGAARPRPLRFPAVASRREQKEALRREREEREREAKAAQARKRIVGYGAAGVLVLVVVVVVGVLALGGDERAPSVDAQSPPERRLRSRAEGVRPHQGRRRGRLRAQVREGVRLLRSHHRPQRARQVQLEPADLGHATT